MIIAPDVAGRKKYFIRVNRGGMTVGASPRLGQLEEERRTPARFPAGHSDPEAGPDAGLAWGTGGSAGLRLKRQQPPFSAFAPA
jgi:hypothetical protein